MRVMVPSDEFLDWLWDAAHASFEPRLSALLLACSMCTGCGLLLDFDEQGASFDGSQRDAALRDSGSMDSGPMDAEAVDATIPGFDGCPTSGCLLECAPNLGMTASAGVVIGTGSWPGFRFQIPQPVTLTSVGLTAFNTTGSAHTVFGAIVALSGPSDYPDDPQLLSADVLGTTTMNLPASSQTTTSGAISLSLAPGWYAAVYGGGAFGGTLTDGVVHDQRGASTCDNGINPFNIVTSTGNFAGQALSPNMFVTVTP
jgi:hypothetical protein